MFEMVRVAPVEQAFRTRMSSLTATHRRMRLLKISTEASVCSAGVESCPAGVCDRIMDNLLLLF